MTVSRTARILIAFVLLAAATFFWLNFFFQNQGMTPSFGFPGPRIGNAPAAPASTPGTGAAPNATPSTPDAASTPAVTVTPTEVPGSPAIPAVAPAGTDIVNREIVVAELPFLVTAPPSLAEPQAEANELAAAGARRPQATLRASVNPFSPILVQQAPAAPAPATIVQVQPEPAVVEVPVPAAPQPILAAETISLPTPRALTPPAPQARNLPRPLPGGTLPVTPDILRNARTAPTPSLLDLASMATIREPENQAPALGGVTGTTPVPVEDDLLNPVVMPQTAFAETPVVETSVDPLIAGTNELSRFLRDNNWRFTGSVLGPVSVGVFRSNLNSVPVVVTLGQSLPETGITLTSLRGQQAELALGDAKQVLTLDLRR